MKHDAALPEPLRTRGARTSLLVLAILCAAPTSAFGENHDPASFVPEFNRICSELARTRADLGAGTLGDEDFADRILALFVAADSMQVALRAAWPGARQAGTPLFAMDRGLRYLIESLRENYVGIVRRNGLSFVEADRALQAAVAWRSGADAMAGVGGADGGIAVGFTESVADAARP